MITDFRPDGKPFGGESMSKEYVELLQRIEELESRMSGMCELQQIQEGKAMETRNIDDERFEKLELLSLKTDERIAALEKSRAEPEIVHCKRWADCTALLHRTAALEKLTCDKGNENANAIASATARVAANEARILALEERLQTVWIAPINALKERCDALEKIANSDDLATSFVKDAWRKDINERIAKIELPMTKESDASIKDHNENMCERFNDIEEKIDELQNTVISVRVLVGKRFESGVA
jgi:hypothetical protein